MRRASFAMLHETACMTSIARLREAGFGDTLVRSLKGRVLDQKRQWVEAIARLETARNALRNAPAV